jgi:hypothetical protein
MSNKKVGSLNVAIRIMYKGEMPKTFRNEGDKEIKYKYFYFENLEKRTCTCVIKSAHTGEKQAVGIARCNPKDKFSLEKGLCIAEYRAKIALYQENIKQIGRE